VSDTPSKQALARARAALAKQLSELGVEEVVLVDDEAFDVAPRQANRLPSLSKAAFREETGSAASEDQQRFARWQSERRKNLTDTDPGVLAAERREWIAEHPEDVHVALEVLAYMCGEHLRPMTGQDWGRLDTAERAAIATGSLVLFDRHLGVGVPAGDELLQEFLGEFPRACAAILTNAVDISDEIEEALSRSHANEGPGSQIDPGRSLIASKQRLMSVRPVDFVEELRITRAAPLLWDLREKLLSLAGAAHREAVRQVRRDIDLRTLEHIVISAARQEGTWEADAFLRVLSIIYRSEAQTRLLATPALGELAGLLGSLRLIFAHADSPHVQAQAKTAELMRLERYDPPALINGAGLALACGDIFSGPPDARDGEESLWMLVEQPCDVQLRDRAGSRDDVLAGDLVRVLSGSPGKERVHELPSGCPCGPDGQAFHLAFASRRSVPFAVLELCVFDGDGRCRVQPAADSPAIAPQTPALSRRFQELLVEHAETLRLALLTEDEDVRARVIGEGGTVDAGAEVLSWPLRRVARLNEPHAQDALRAVSEDRSRLALDVDLAR
jgi:hypothetical protein